LFGQIIQLLGNISYAKGWTHMNKTYINKTDTTNHARSGIWT
jgi:hypothetical protein